MKAQGYNCPLDGRSVTCTGPDESVLLTGTCSECGTQYEVAQYTPVPFKGDVDPHSPLQGAVVKGAGGVAHPVIGTDKDSIVRGNETFQQKYQTEIAEAQKQHDEREAQKQNANPPDVTPDEGDPNFVTGKTGVVTDERYSDNQPSAYGDSPFGAFKYGKPETTTFEGQSSLEQNPNPQVDNVDTSIGGKTDGSTPTPTNSADVTTETPNPLQDPENPNNQGGAGNSYQG